MATANIDSILNNILTAVYGRDMRNYIYEGVRVVNDIVSKSVLIGVGTPVGNVNPTYLDMVYFDIGNLLVYKTVSGQNNTIVWDNQGSFEGRGFSGGFVDVTPAGAGLNKTYEISFNKGTPSTTQIHVKNGNGITNITGPVTDGLGDTYTIHFDDGYAFEFTVTNAKSISEITGPVTEGLIDTYTIEFNNEYEFEFNIANGEGITSITGPVSDGLEDTYTIHYKEADDTEFIIRNGKDGHQWYRGTAILGKDVNPTVFANSGIDLAKEDDFYLNPVEGAVYYCYQGGDPTVAAWCFDFVITGSGSTGVSEINDLIDVSLDEASLQDGQLLARVGNEWTNQPAPNMKIDKKFNPTSEAAQSGKAIAEAFRDTWVVQNNTKPKKFVDMDWTGLTSFNGNRIWTDGVNIYYSNGASQYKLNGTTWEPMTWSGLTSFYGYDVWTDGVNIYYSNNTNQYKLNGTTWEPMTWSGLTSFSGDYIWTDGSNIYYSSGTSQYKLNGTTWELMTWSGLSDFLGNCVWTDGVNIYYSDANAQYKLNGTTWDLMTWAGLSDLHGENIWTDGVNIYCFEGSSQYKLDGTTWEEIVIFGISNTFASEYVWTNGVDVYYSNDVYQYKLVPFEINAKPSII